MVLPVTVSPRVLPACALQGAFVSSFAVGAFIRWLLKREARARAVAQVSERARMDASAEPAQLVRSNGGAA